MSKNKYQITLTFPTQELLDFFCSQWCDGNGEQDFSRIVEEQLGLHIGFNYSRCFPAWGWKEGDPKYIDMVEFGEEE